MSRVFMFAAVVSVGLFSGCASFGPGHRADIFTPQDPVPPQYISLEMPRIDPVEGTLLDDMWWETFIDEHPVWFAVILLSGFAYATGCLVYVSGKEC